MGLRPEPARLRGEVLRTQHLLSIPARASPRPRMESVSVASPRSCWCLIGRRVATWRSVSYSHLVRILAGASPRPRMTRPLVLLVTILGKPRPDVSVLQYHVSPDLVGLRPEPGPSSYSDRATLAVSFVTSSPDFVGHLSRASSRPPSFAVRASFLADC